MALALVARVSVGRRCRRGCWRGRCGTWWHRVSPCVAGVALGDIDGHFAWQSWHLATWTSTLRGRPGTWRHGPALCVAGVALIRYWAGSDGALGSQLAPWTPPLFVWQAWHLVTSSVAFESSSHGQSSWQCHCFFTEITSAVLFCSARYQFHRACAVVAHFDPKSWRYSLRFCLLPLIFHVARYLSVFITHTPPPPLVKTQPRVLVASRFVVPPFDTYIHAYIHTSIHPYIHTSIHPYIHTSIHPSIHTYIHACMHAYIHTIFLCHTPSFTYHFVTHNCFYFSILHHILCLSFLPRPATTSVAHCWKKLTCGVIRSFNDVVNFEAWGSLAKLFRFWHCQIQKLRGLAELLWFWCSKTEESRRIAVVLMLSNSRTAKVSQNSFVFKLANSQIDR